MQTNIHPRLTAHECTEPHDWPDHCKLCTLQGISLGDVGPLSPVESFSSFQLEVAINVSMYFPETRTLGSPTC